ncbi:O-fucosyltransferase family protein isoform 2 [Hibiscus syriacus]|uniref:O-fucosyltransferase family protein n=1 Tax=Hibiscus syriacus TaxID=106335 RepID=A0A6A2XD71_HIBSY|nr:O-fucosyltransferase family protein isoform 2 [Hibiscus syriacus]
MRKQGSPRCARPISQITNSFFRTKDGHTRSSNSDSLGATTDPSIGRRILGADNYGNSKVVLLHGLKDDSGKLNPCKGVYVGVSAELNLQGSSTSRYSNGSEEDRAVYTREERPSVHMYNRLLNLATGALAEKESKQDGLNFWEEPYHQASKWKPSADKKYPTSPGKPAKSNGYIMVSANGGLNQQRVATCNAVAVASLLNATLVIPKFLYSNVWKDPSSETMSYTYHLDDIDIVKELPPHLKSLDIEAIGSIITDSDIVKEAKPDDYLSSVLPLLLEKRVVHFLGFGNRLGFDPLPPHLQRLRCKCNFHALKFVPKIQEVGSLLVKRIKKSYAATRRLDKQLLGDFTPRISSKQHNVARGTSIYLALHLRFEEDMVAYSLCDFGGGEDEKKELQAYREIHFPLLIERLRDTKKLGRCPLTPEEAALVLAALGFKPVTYSYFAGSHTYGGNSRMHPFTSLYPNLVTKETLLTPSELAPFRNFSSQLAALDFIACATSDVFAMTDSGSQLSSLVSGFRTYYGDGNAPTLRPNKKRLAAILAKNRTMG